MWEQILRADEANLAYFAARSALPGVALFCSERADAPEFDVALIQRVRATDAGATLHAIADHFWAQGRRPRVRLSPLSAPADWPARLRQAGFVEMGERLTYFSVPETAQLVANPAVRVRRVVSAEDGDRFSAIQVAGFDLPPEHREWDRTLVHRHLAAGEHVFYLASLNERAVGAARSIHQADGATGLAALATLPRVRGRGVGTSVLARMIEDAREAGSGTIFGTITPGSYAAGMYARLGFVQLFSVRTFVGPANDGRRHGATR
jgi:GNAT superfamily N-acetyltransferase